MSNQENISIPFICYIQDYLQKIPKYSTNILQICHMKNRNSSVALVTIRFYNSKRKNKSKKVLFDNLPICGTTWKNWTSNTRQMMDGRENILKLLSYKLRVYDDECPFVMYLWTRQTTKSPNTLCFHSNLNHFR